MSTIKFESVPATAQSDTPADGPRKRRKRAPAAGAANDCFTCQNRNIKCSRGRPYCSQCLDSGQDCGGYKTQLTWGVGVASRGKLRGLSLPVAGTKKATDATSPPRTKKRPSPDPATRAPPSNPTFSPVSPESFRRHAPISESTQPAPIIHDSGYQNFYNGLQHAAQSSPTQDIIYEQKAVDAQSAQLAPTSTSWSTVNVFQDHHFSPPQVSPLSYSAPSHHGGHVNLIPPAYSHYHTAPRSYSMSSDMSTSLQSTIHSSDMYSTYPPRSEPYDSHGPYLTPTSTIPISTLTNRISPWPEEEIEEIKREFDEETVVSDALVSTSGPPMFDLSFSFSPFSGVSSVGKTPRIQYLIQYYAEVIAPVIVAFDGPSNPFRDQILTLAAKSESLQHAISALAASNLRQRRETGILSTGKTLPARRSSAAHLSLTNEAWYSAPSLSFREQKREEVYHKYHAVQSLNQALASQTLRKDDSVLATLLILCLFHICDSGIARFQTQFAGVKKLITMRRNELRGTDSSTRWIEKIFTWFDAMAATVNDREGQFEPHFLDLATISDSEWSYETLAGVDGRLFKIMSKLGRINILSQGKQVEDNATLVSRPMPTFSNDLNSFDGNGWMRIIDDEDFFNAKTSDPNIQEQFWREWREIRHALQTWTMEDHLTAQTSTIYSGASPTDGPQGSNSPQLTPDQLLDVNNISNAFRYSSLLYTERLGNPRLPSSDEKIQYWVRFSVQYIRQVRSDVYLLWPLFITGSECVHEEDRNIIRERCLDIQKDSGFVNNASCLALLEKVWNVVPVVGQHQTQDQNLGSGSLQQEMLDGEVNGFRFRDVMHAEGNEGEWIVV